MCIVAAPAMMRHMTSNRMGRMLAVVAAAAIGAALLARAAISNGYSLIYYDSGAYLAMSVQRWPHFERPIPYPLFLAATGLQRTLFTPVIVQAIIVFALLYVAFRWVARLQFAATLMASLAAATILSFFTGASYTITWLIPDVFTSVFILSLATLLAAERLSKWQLTFLGGLAIAAAATHPSHLLIGLVLAVVLLVTLVLSRLGKVKSAPSAKRLMFGATVALMGWAALLGINVAVTHRSFLLEASSVYLAGKLADNGILKSFLDAHPDGYAMAAYRDRLPMDVNQFLWRKNSPLVAMGGWKRSRHECDRLVRDILRRPKYLAWFVALGLRDGATMLCWFDVCSFEPFVKRPEVLPPLKRYYPRDVPRFLAADQQQGGLVERPGGRSFAVVNVGQRVLAVVALLFFIATLLAPNLRRAIGPAPISFSVVVFLLVIVNAFVCGALSSLDARYQSRVIWLLPLTSMVLLAGWWAKRHEPAAALSL